MKFSMKPWSSNNPWIFYGSAIGIGIAVVALAILAVGVPLVKGASTPTEEIISPEPNPLVLEFLEFESVAPLPDLLDLQPVERVSLGEPLPWYSDMLGLDSCLDFEVMDTSTRKLVLREAMGNYVESGTMGSSCVRRHSAHAGELLRMQCRKGDTLSKAFSQVLGYFEANCFMLGLDPYEDQDEEPFNIIEELF